MEKSRTRSYDVTKGFSHEKTRLHTHTLKEITSATRLRSSFFVHFILLPLKAVLATH